jgi:hypothetical protein
VLWRNFSFRLLRLIILRYAKTDAQYNPPQGLNLILKAHRITDEYSALIKAIHCLDLVLGRGAYLLLFINNHLLQWFFITLRRNVKLSTILDIMLNGLGDFKFRESLFDLVNVESRIYLALAKSETWRAENLQVECLINE